MDRRKKLMNRSYLKQQSPPAFDMYRTTVVTDITKLYNINLLTILPEQIWFFSIKKKQELHKQIVLLVLFSSDILWLSHSHRFYLPAPPLGQDMIQGQFLSGV